MVTLEGLLHHLATKGVLRSVRHYWIRFRDLMYERRLGIRTQGLIPLATVGINDPEFGAYSPTSYTEFRRLMRHVPIQAGRDVFMDYGSGLGRVLIVAATYPFRKVVGIEVVERFNADAAENFARCRGRLKCTELQLLTADASFCLPPAEVTGVLLL